MLYNTLYKQKQAQFSFREEAQFSIYKESKTRNIPHATTLEAVIVFTSSMTGFSVSENKHNSVSRAPENKNRKAGID